MPSKRVSQYEKSYFQGGNPKANNFWNYGGIDNMQGKNLKRKKHKRKKK